MRFRAETAPPLEKACMIIRRCGRSGEVRWERRTSRAVARRSWRCWARELKTWLREVLRTSLTVDSRMRISAAGKVWRYCWWYLEMFLRWADIQVQRTMREISFWFTAVGDGR